MPPLTATKLIKAFDLYRFCVNKYTCYIYHEVNATRKTDNVNLVVYRDLKMVFCLDTGFFWQGFVRSFRYIFYEIKTFGRQCFYSKIVAN